MTHKWTWVDTIAKTYYHMTKYEENGAIKEIEWESYKGRMDVLRRDIDNYQLFYANKLSI